MRRPSLSFRTASSPASPQSAPQKPHSRLNNFNMLTPPSSPPRRVGSSSDLKLDFKNLESLRSSIDHCRPSKYTQDNILICPHEVSYITSPDGQPQTFGHGAWSTVLKGTCQTKQSSTPGLITPPAYSTATVPLLVAVKRPGRGDAKSILRNEARTLTALRSLDYAEKHVAAFHGIIDNENALVSSAHPLSLEDYIRNTNSTTDSGIINNAAIPATGNILVWLDLAEKLVTTLDWLHNQARVVHGDIKPGNILLKLTTGASTNDKFAYEPLLIDFSSSRQLDTSETPLNTLSAVTMEYTAPELLKASVLSDPKSCATIASDVFSMAVTLLVAATGDIKVYTGSSHAHRQIFATSGNSILGTMRSLGYKLPRQGPVSRVLEKAFLKPDVRLDTKAWLQMIREVRRDTSDNQPPKM